MPRSVGVDFNPRAIALPARDWIEVAALIALRRVETFDQDRAWSEHVTNKRAARTSHGIRASHRLNFRSIGFRPFHRSRQRLEMMLLKEVKPRWDVTLDAPGHATLYPSVWLRGGCQSHFWIRAGKVIWCE